MRVWVNLAMLAHQRKEHRRAHHLAAITFNLNQASHDAEYRDEVLMLLDPL